MASILKQSQFGLCRHEEVEKEPKKKHKKKKMLEKKYAEDLSDDNIAAEPVETHKHKKNKQTKIKKHAEQKPRLSFQSAEDEDDEFILKKHQKQVSRSPSFSRSPTPDRRRMSRSPSPYGRSRSPSPLPPKKGKKASKNDSWDDSFDRSSSKQRRGADFESDSRRDMSSSPERFDYEKVSAKKKTKKIGKHKQMVSDSGDSDFARERMPPSPQIVKKDKKRRSDDIQDVRKVPERDSRHNSYEREQLDNSRDYSSSRGKLKDKSGLSAPRERTQMMNPSPHKDGRGRESQVSDSIRDSRRDQSPESQRSGSQYQRSGRRELSPQPMPDRHREVKYYISHLFY